MANIKLDLNNLSFKKSLYYEVIMCKGNKINTFTVLGEGAQGAINHKKLGGYELIQVTEFFITFDEWSKQFESINEILTNLCSDIEYLSERFNYVIDTVTSKLIRLASCPSSPEGERMNALRASFKRIII